MSTALQAYCAQNKPVGRPEPKLSNKEFIALNLAFLQKMEADGFSDQQMAEAVSAATGRAISEATFRRYFDRAQTTPTLRPRRTRLGQAATTRAVADRTEKPGGSNGTEGPVIEHNPLEHTGTRVPDLFRHEGV